MQLYVGCKYSETLDIIKYGNKYCRNWFYEYDTSKYFDYFDQSHGLKKRCKTCMDNIMKN